MRRVGMRGRQHRRRRRGRPARWHVVYAGHNTLTGVDARAGTASVVAAGRAVMVSMIGRIHGQRVDAVHFRGRSRPDNRRIYGACRHLRRHGRGSHAVDHEGQGEQPVGNEAGKRHNTSLYRRTLRRASVGQDRATWPTVHTAPPGQIRERVAHFHHLAVSFSEDDCTSQRGLTPAVHTSTDSPTSGLLCTCRCSILVCTKRAPESLERVRLSFAQAGIPLEFLSHN